MSLTSIRNDLQAETKVQLRVQTDKIGNEVKHKLPRDEENHQ